MSDVTSRLHGGNPESVEANASMGDHKVILRQRIARYIWECGSAGATSDEIEVALGLSHQTVSARLTEMKIMGYVQPGERRVTRSGRYARALVHMEFSHE